MGAGHSIYKSDQFAYNGIELSPLGQAIIHGEDAERWPGEGTARGPTMDQMFEVYSTRYEDTGPRLRFRRASSTRYTMAIVSPSLVLASRRR